MRGSGRLGVHKVGLTASAAGLLSVLLLSFGRLRPFRLAAGEPIALFEGLGPALALVPVLLWLGIVVLSVVAPRTRPAALARGILAGALVPALLWLSNSAAVHALVGAEAFARYSIGPGVWVSLFAALALVLDSRRAVGVGTKRSFVVSALAPVGVVVLVATGSLSSLGMAAEYRNVSEDFPRWFGQHALYSGVAMAIAILAGVTLGIAAHRRRAYAEPIFATTSIVQTIPGLAMIGVLAVPLGYAGRSPFLRSLGVGVLGWSPVIVALTLYALLILVRNTYEGLLSVPAPAVDAGEGMGMTRSQLLRKVQLPLAAPVIFSGTRTAFQQTIGNAALAYFVAAGSLGRPIFSGVSQQASDLVLLGSVALVALALTADIVLRAAERLVSPRRVGAPR